MKRFSKIFGKIAVAVTAVSVALGGGAFTSQARGLIDTDRTGSLTVTCKYGEDRYFDGVEVNIYKVGSVDSTKQGFVIDDAYAGVSPITDLSSINDETTAASEWASVLAAVEPYAVDNMSPTATAVSSSGLAVFEGLELGIYLVRSSSVVDENDACTYVFSSFLVSVPQLDSNDEWVYEAAARAKCEKDTLIEEFELLKRWNDSGAESSRPSSITVTIKRDGNVYDTVTLNSDNNWRHSWSEAAGSLWTFEESVSGNVSYSVSLSDSKANIDGRIKITYILTNTYNPPETPDTPTDQGVLGAIRNLPEVLGARRLPQTGQLWWPLPILLILGVLLIVKGIRNTKSNNV